MDFKFAKISEVDIVNKNNKKMLIRPFTATVKSVEEKTKNNNGKIFGKFLLAQGKSKIVVLAFGDIYEAVRNVLMPTEKITFPTKTFSCEPRKKNFESMSTCKYDLTFQYGPFISEARKTLNTSQARSTISEACSVQEVLKELSNTKQTVTKKLKSIEFRGGKIYRYWGCENCCTSIPRKHTDGQYYCNGIKCNDKKTRKSKIGVATQRKLCFTVYDLELSDNKHETIASAVVFDRICGKLLQKCGHEFRIDEEVVDAWYKLIARYRFDITIKRNKKKKGDQYVPAVIVNELDNVVQQDAAGEITDEYRGPWPKFPKYEMKLKQIAEPSFNPCNWKYKISSKPPGLVLLINNYHYPNMHEPERKGSEIDMDSIYNGFTEMGYKIFGNEWLMDIQTREEFSDIIAEFKRQLIEEEVDSIFIIISSHGVNHGIDLAGGDRINVLTELMIPFSDDNFPQYQGKPKVFMPIVCQNMAGFDDYHTNSLDDLGLDNKLFDMLICCPVLPGYAQNRISNLGTLYSQLLMKNLMDYAQWWDLVQILNKVQYDVKEEIVKNDLKKWTVPHHITIVFRPFYLIPTASG